jgi:PhoH-like ATPase
LLDAHNLLTLGQTSTIVLPEVVLDELDSKKSGLNELAFQAREFGRLLTKATKIETVRDGNLIINKLQLNSINIEVVSLKTYPDYSDSEPNIVGHEGKRDTIGSLIR